MRRPDRGAHEQEEIEEEDCNEDEAADEDVRSKPHDCFMFGEVKRRDVSVLMVAFVHADKLTPEI